MIKYFRTFSRREIYSAIFSAMMIVALLFFSAVFFILIFEYFSINIEMGFMFIYILPALFSLALGHRFYLKEHHRPNDLSGRICQDLLIFVFLFFVLGGMALLLNMFHRIGSVGNLALLSFVVVFLTEIFLSMLNFIFRLFGWQIW